MSEPGRSHHSPRIRSGRFGLALIAVILLVSSACSSGDDSDTPETVPDDATTSEETTPDATDPAADGDSAPPASTPGITDETITIGFTYINLADLLEAGIIDTNHGPYDQQIQALVDDLNERGGIHGRQVEVISVGYDPVGNEAQQAACIELTEDEEVFAVLGSIRGDNVLCYTEQHETIAIMDRNMSEERLARAAAPYATAGPTEERILTEMVDTAAAEGLLDGATVAVHSTEPENHSLATDVLTPALEAAGANVVFKSLIEVGGSDVGASGEAIAFNAQLMADEDVDTVFVVGDSLVVSTTFAAEGFTPTLFLGDMGSAQGLAEGNDLSVFDGVYTFGDFVDPERYEEATFQEECVPIWDAAHPDDPVRDPRDLVDDEPNHTVGLGTACRTLSIFVAAAEAAGTELTTESFLTSLESVGPIDLPGYGPGSITVDKYDAQDDLVLYAYDAADPDAFRGFARYEG